MPDQTGESDGRGKRWDDDSATSVRRPATRSVTTRAFRLTVTAGADVGVSAEVDGTSTYPVLIGTSDACTIRVRDPEVSRRHVSLRVVDDSLRIRDLDSTNGTLLNGARIIEALLLGGEELRIGGTTFRVELEPEARTVPVATMESFGGVLGGSLAMRMLYPLCQRLAASDVPLVIEGETGTGKEALAEAIHLEGKRSAGPFVVFDCTATPGALIESALFGHERGAFTGASSAHTGIFEEASGGTLLIDEIGDLEGPLQSKLLRAIQKSEIRRVGGNRWIPVNVRIIAATRRDLDQEVQAGRFRDDLFFRLAVARIVIPPLRERREDVERLARHFWAFHSTANEPFPEYVLERFMRHPWPGNVRELANTVARISALGELAEAHSSLFLRRDSGAAPPTGEFLDQVILENLELPRAREIVLREFERRYVERLLDAHQGNISRAAAASGIGERYLRTIRARVRQG